MTPTTNIIGRTAVLNLRSGKWEIQDKRGVVLHECDDLHEAAEYLAPPKEKENETRDS